MLKDLQARAKSAWWLVLIMGVVSIVFGAVVLLLPGQTFVTLMTMFVVLLFIEGIAETVYGLSAIRKDSSWWLSVLLGVVLLGTSVYIVRNPAITAVVFAIVVGWVLIVRGAFEFMFGATLAEGRMRELLFGLVSIAAGIAMLVFPASGILALTWVLGLYALINGVVMLSSAFAVRSMYEVVRRETFAV